MINNHHRWSLLAILGSAVLLITGNRPLLDRAARRPGHNIAPPSVRGTAAGLTPDAARDRPAVERLG